MITKSQRRFDKKFHLTTYLISSINILILRKFVFSNSSQNNFAEELQTFDSYYI